MNALTDRLNELARSAIQGHFATWISRTGIDITHHEPVDHIKVRLSERALRQFLALHPSDQPREVDGVPLKFVEQPAPGLWDMSLVCQYHSERFDKIVGSRGALCVLPKETV